MLHCPFAVASGQKSGLGLARGPELHERRPTGDQRAARLGTFAGAAGLPTVPLSNPGQRAGTGGAPRGGSMYQVLPGVAAETAVLGTQFTAPLPAPAQKALAFTGAAIGLYLVV